VTVTSIFPTVRVGEYIYVAATVTGTGRFNSAVTWSVNGVPGGNAVNGTVANNYYTAPAAIPPTNPVTLTATSVQDTTKSGSTAVSVFTISISPATATVSYNHTKQFTAVVKGVTNPVVHWLAYVEAVDDSGLYTANNSMGQGFQDTLTAYIDGGSPTTATVTLVYPQPVLTSTTPTGGSANEPLTINGQDIFDPVKVLFPGPSGTMIPVSVPVDAWTWTEIHTAVPPGAVSGDAVVQFNATGTITTASVPFTRLPNVRIRAGIKDLTPGETVQFESRILGPSSPNALTWTADLGTISSTGLYQAPAITQESFATVNACIDETRSCDSTILRIVPLRIAPASPAVGLGQTLQLDAIEGSLASANWSVLAGGGSITSGGLFTAPTNPVQGGAVPVSATVGSDSTIANVAVTGAFPGLIGRTADYINFSYDLNQGQYLQRLEGTDFRNLSVRGNRAYTLSLGVRATPPFNANPPFTALDVYDISDPVNAVWLDAIDSVSGNPQLLSTYGHYLFEVDTRGSPLRWDENQPSRIVLYDIQSDPPKLISAAYISDTAGVCDNNGVIYGTVWGSFEGQTVPIYVFDIRSGSIQQQEIDIIPPVDTQERTPPFQVIGRGNLIYAEFVTQAGDPLLATYDISVSPPSLLGTVPIPKPLLSSSNALIRGNLLYWNDAVYDISNPLPVLLSVLPTQEVLDVQGNQLLGLGFFPSHLAQDHYVLVDIRDPSRPVTKAIYWDHPDWYGGIPKFTGNGSRVLSVEGTRGLATLDVSAAGGLIDKARIEVFPGGDIFDHTIVGQTLYVAGWTQQGLGGLLTFDLSTGTPVWEGATLYGQKPGFAVRVTGSTAFLGLLDSLRVINVTDPFNPVEVTSLPFPTNALALTGTSLFAGTRDAQLVSLSVTDPHNPAVLGSVPLPSPPVNMRIVGSKLFVADGPGGLLIFDITNPATPVLLSQLTLSTPVWDVAVAGSLAFLAADSGGLVVADISNLLQPKQLSQTNLDAYYPELGIPTYIPTATALTVHDGLVYVGTGDCGSVVFGFDYSQPTYPRLVARRAFGEFIYTVVSGFSFLGNDILVVGGLGALDDIVQSDATAPRNAINLYYPPMALRQMIGGAAKHKAKPFVHPKVDFKTYQKRHLKRRLPQIGSGLRLH